MTGCMVCGNPLTAATTRKRYCSDACRQGAYRNRTPTPTPTPLYRNKGSSAPSTGVTAHVYPERVLDPRIGSNPDGSTPGAIQGDYPLEYYEEGMPKLPACLDRRKLKLERDAA
jgi:hypothetical protein